MVCSSPNCQSKDRCTKLLIDSIILIKAFYYCFLTAFGTHSNSLWSVTWDFLWCKTAKRLPRAQPAQNPAGMVLVDRPAESSQAASCCS
ncbi:Ras-related protein Rab5 [Vitis vinifera]|uniref:Ras-related protein Rab5 n=1 Tax=Vitis vinifera TaxID=29760 RepID=A0A438E270_VITVI|nr:Ras-related protein Rab5 [Vitis vinifera]RVW61109.1 Ras-related protein Rab5 [Vitis vinifera]